MTGPAPPEDPLPPRSDERPSGWQDYQPRAIESSPRRERERAHKTHLLVGTAMAVAVIVLVVAGVLVSRALISPGTTGCSPSPCADDGSGFQVYVASVDRNVATSPPPANGGHIVRVSVRFKNTAGAARVANPLDFKLEDATGQRHDLLLDVGASCGVFEGVNVPSGSMVGPKAMCFMASGEAQAKLTLLWSPQTREIAIDLP